MSKLPTHEIDFASVLRAVPQPIAICDPLGKVVFLNHRGREFLGLQEGDAEETVVFALDRRETFSNVRLEDRGPYREYFLSHVTIEGAPIKEASMNVSPMGEAYFRVVLEDAPEPTMAPILDQLDALVAICDSRRRVQLTNAALSRHLDDSTKETPDLLSFFAEEDVASVRVAASEALAGGEPGELTVRTNLGLPEGLERVRLRLRPVRSGGERRRSSERALLMVAQPARETFTEIERRQARAEELMSLGELATGVAHELKNPLTSILNYAHYLSEKYQGQFLDERDGDRLQRIIDGVERIDRFVRDLLKLAGTDGLEISEIDLHGVLRESVSLCAHALADRGIDVRWELEGEHQVIAGNDGALHQVFMNLVLNAARAMPEGGGMVTLRTTSAPGRAIVEVEDDANGMSQATMARIFEPFYSTCTDGKGAGLGLALVRRIVTQHGGTIEVESTPGVGSVFSLVFPT